MTIDNEIKKLASDYVAVLRSITNAPISRPARADWDLMCLLYENLAAVLARKIEIEGIKQVRFQGELTDTIKSPTVSDLGQLPLLEMLHGG